MITVNDKRASRGVRMMKVVVNSKERNLADRELRRRIKDLDRERLILVSKEKIARGKRLFTARRNGTGTGTGSEEEIIRETNEREDAKKN